MLVSSTEKCDDTGPNIVVVGAGVAGIATGIALKQQLKYSNFKIYEKSSAVGGTWRDNFYPGCGCDIAAHWYSLSSDLNPSWSQYLVRQPEILAYWKGLWDKYRLEKHTVLNTSVLSAEWDDSTQSYHVVAEDLPTGKQDSFKAQVMIYANGGFKEPFFPHDLPGIEHFKGLALHSAKWSKSVDLKDKKVAVIGNGCSGAQIVAAIAQDTSTTVVNFCRSPQWYIGARNHRYPSCIQYMFQQVPGLMRVYRNIIMLSSDLIYPMHSTNPLCRRLARKMFTQYIKSMAPAEHWENMIPKYPVGCTRMVVDPGYLKCLSNDNVSLRWDSLDCIVPRGIKMKSGEVIPLDIIVFATGYKLDKFGAQVRGRNGQNLEDFYEAQGGLTAYLGMAMPGFPNLFGLLGPNVATGHASAIFSEEVQIQLVMQIIKPIIDGKANSFEIKEQVFTEYNKWLQNRLKKSVWAACSSYYHTDRKRGKITAVFPGPVTLFWYLARKPKWGEWKGVGDELWRESLRSRSGVNRYLGGLALVVFFLVLLSCGLGLQS